jgi:hypothetical protein
MAVRSDGTLLVTRVDVPEVWSIDVSTGAGSVLIKVPAPITSVTGITELSPDVFAIGVGQYDLIKGTIPGTFEVWTFSLVDGTAAGQSSLRHVCKIPDAGLLNGMVTWDSTSVLTVDSSHGVIYKVDINAGTSNVILSDELAKPPADAPLPIGINGIKIRDGYVYFTNSARLSFYRVPVNKDTAIPSGPVELVASGFANDDFTFDTEGSAYICTHVQNTVIKLAPGSTEMVTVAGKSDSLDIAGGTSCAFGRRADDTRTLYVTVAGALSMPVNGETEPAKVVAIDLE